MVLYIIFDILNEEEHWDRCEDKIMATDITIIP